MDQWLKCDCIEIEGRSECNCQNRDYQLGDCGCDCDDSPFRDKEEEPYDMLET